MIQGDSDTVRDQLKNYRALVLKHEAYKTIREQLYPRVTATINDQPSGKSDMCELESIVEKRLELSKKIDKILAEMLNSIDEIMKMIECINDIEQVIIILRYVEGMSWRKIENKVCYSRQHCMRLHDRAIDKIEIGRRR